jgi:photosystem II stability/assembly factor-like uncharacterized protein
MCAFLQVAGAQNSWELVSPRLPNESMECVRGTASGLVLTVGSSGVVLRSIDSGSTWNWIKTGTAKWLYGVGISPSEKCIAVGENGTILVSSDRGVSWTQRNSPAFLLSQLSDIHQTISLRHSRDQVRRGASDSAEEDCR